MTSNSSSVENLSDLFKWPEYVVFSLMLCVSAGIGVFYGCVGSKQKTTKEFLLANRSMSTFPMAMSLLASFLSAITLLGTPAEMYQYGTQYWMIGPSYVLTMAGAGYLYMPVFFNLQVTSAYEYLGKRFSRPVRLVGSGTFALQMTIYMAIVVYAPALALSQVTGLNVYGCVVAIFVVCVFYTALGGMKAVIYTDTFQVIVMFGAMLAVVIKGAIDEGGHAAVWQKNEDGGRIEFFNLDPDPRTRHTVWGLLIGGYFTWVTIYGCNQAQVQRYLTVATIRQAHNAIWINLFGLAGLLSICCYAGLIIYSKYADCDPLSSGRIKTADQLFPLLVMDTLGTIPGLPGLFVAGIFAGALSTVSSGLNSLAAITLEDFLKGTCYPNMTDKTATKVSKLLSVVFGLICFGLVFVAEQLGGVLQAALSIFGMVGGPLLGVFTLGMFFPWANAKGAFVGTLTSLAFMLWLGFGANIAVARKEIVNPKLNFSTDGCMYGNFTVKPVIHSQEGGLLEFYKISYMWYSFIGSGLVIIVGMLVSFITGLQDPRKLNPDYISPAWNKFLQCILPESVRLAIRWDIGAEFDRISDKIITTGPNRRHVSSVSITYPNTYGLENSKAHSTNGKNGVDNPSFQRDDLHSNQNRRNETGF